MPTPFELSLRDDAILRAVAGGAPRAKVLVAYDLTPAQYQSILTHGEAKLASYRERLQLATQLNEQFVEALAPQAATNVEIILRDPSHKQHAEISWKVLERALPDQKVTLGGNVGLAMSEETATALANALTSLVTHRQAQPTVVDIDDDPHMVDSLPRGPQ